METLEYVNKKGEVYKFWSLDTEVSQFGSDNGLKVTVYFIDYPTKFLALKRNAVLMHHHKDDIVTKDFYFNIDYVSLLDKNTFKPIKSLPDGVSILETKDENIIFVSVHREKEGVRQYKLEELSNWFYSLPDENEFSESRNEDDEIGCLLTQFFKSKNIRFETVTLDSARCEKDEDVAEVLDSRVYISCFFDIFYIPPFYKKITKKQILEKYPNFLKHY